MRGIIIRTKAVNSTGRRRKKEGINWSRPRTFKIYTAKLFTIGTMIAKTPPTPSSLNSRIISSILQSNDIYLYPLLIGKNGTYN